MLVTVLKCFVFCKQAVSPKEETKTSGKC